MQVRKIPCTLPYRRSVMLVKSKSGFWWCITERRVSACLSRDVVYHPKMTSVGRLHRVIGELVYRGSFSLTVPVGVQGFYAVDQAGV